MSSSLALLSHHLMTYLITLMFSLALVRLTCVLNFILYQVDLLFNVNQVQPGTSSLRAQINLSPNALMVTVSQARAEHDSWIFLINYFVKLILKRRNPSLSLPVKQKILWLGRFSKA